MSLISIKSKKIATLWQDSVNTVEIFSWALSTMSSMAVSPSADHSHHVPLRYFLLPAALLSPWCEAVPGLFSADGTTSLNPGPDSSPRLLSTAFNSFIGGRPNLLLSGDRESCPVQCISAYFNPCSFLLVVFKCSSK